MKKGKSKKTLQLSRISIKGQRGLKSPVVLVQLISQFFNRRIVVQLNSENKLTNVETSIEVFGNVLSKTASLSLPAVNKRTMMKLPLRINDIYKTCKLQPKIDFFNLVLFVFSGASL